MTDYFKFCTEKYPALYLGNLNFLRKILLDHLTESAGAYATYDINLRFPTVMPSERQYYDYRYARKSGPLVA